MFAVVLSTISCILMNNSAGKNFEISEYPVECNCVYKFPPTRVCCFVESTTFRCAGVSAPSKFVSARWVRAPRIGLSSINAVRACNIAVRDFELAFAVTSSTDEMRPRDRTFFPVGWKFIFQIKVRAHAAVASLRNEIVRRDEAKGGKMRVLSLYSPSPSLRKLSVR